MVNNDLTSLRDDYPGAEFFTYDIDNPGYAGISEDLEPGEYGTLAAQLDVRYTPFVAMLAPGEEGYVVEEVFQGYVDQTVLDQALYELSNTCIDDDPTTGAEGAERGRYRKTPGSLPYARRQARARRGWPRPSGGKAAEGLGKGSLILSLPKLCRSLLYSNTPGKY